MQNHYEEIVSVSLIEETNYQKEHDSYDLG